MNNHFKLGKPLNVIWHFKRPDGENYSLAGLQHELVCYNSRGRFKIKDSVINVEDTGVLSFTLKEEMQTVEGAYSFHLSLLRHGKTVNTVVKNDAVILSKHIIDTDSIQEDEPTTIDIFSVGEFELFRPTAPVAGSDGWWYFDGQPILDNEGNKVPINVTIDIDDDPESKTFGIITLDKGRDGGRETVITGMRDTFLKVREQGDITEAQGIKAERQGNTAESQGSVAEGQGNVAEAQGLTAKAQGEKTEQQGNIAEQKGSYAAQLGNTAEEQGNTAKQRGEKAEQQGNTAEAQGNVAEQQGLTAKAQGERAEAQGNTTEAQGMQAIQIATDKGDEAISIAQTAANTANTAAANANTAAQEARDGIAEMVTAVENAKDDIIKEVEEGKLAELEQEVLVGSAVGRNSDWVFIKFSALRDIPYILNLTGNITDATSEGQEAFVQVELILKDGTKRILSLYVRGQEFQSGKMVDLGTYENNIKQVTIEGRWHDNEVLKAILLPNPNRSLISETSQEVNNLTNSMQAQVKSSLRAWHTAGAINFNNIKGCVEISEEMYAFSPIDGKQVTISSGDIPYSFSSANSTLVYLVYDCEQESVRFAYRHQIQTYQIPIVAFYITSEGPYKVKSICWTLVDNTSIDGNNRGTIDTIKSVRNEIKNVALNLGTTPLAENSTQGRDSSWAQFQVTTLSLIKAGTPFIVEFNGNITSAAEDGQTFLGWMTIDAAGAKKYLKILTGKESASYVDGMQFIYQLDYDIKGIAIEGRWLQSDILSAAIYAGLGVELKQLQDKLETSIENNTIIRNVSKDAIVRSTGVRVDNGNIKPLSFIHMSDIHTKSNNYQCLSNACQYLEHYANLKFAIVTGDIVWDTFADKMDWYNAAILNTSKPVLNVIGNHDSGQNMGETSLSKVSTDVECYNKYIAPYVNKWGVVQPQGAATEGKSYYYKDFSDEQIRLIVLCEFETDYEINPNDSTQLLYSREYRAMRQAQVNWLIATLNETPSNYGVIVALHQPDTLNNEENDFVSYNLVNKTIANVYADDKEWLLKIFDAFQNRKAISFSFNQTGAVLGTINVDCDFTNTNSELICILCGHTHDDYIGHYKNYPKINVLVVGSNNLLYTGKVCQRKEGTPSEDLFNVVNIDRNRRKISITRIGADGSAYGQYRNHMTIDYL